MDETQNSSSSLKQERIRMNFRDFFIYAIKGTTSDPIQPGVCTSSCIDSSHCCASIVATDTKTSKTTMDNVCMLQNVVNSWKDFTLDNVSYSMQCGDQKAVSKSNTLR